MKRYFFDIDYAGLKSEDKTGAVLADRDAASQELLLAVIETAAGALRGKENAVISGVVRQEGGEIIFECQVELRSKWLS